MRGILKKAAPKATEAVKWGVPVFEEKRILFAFAAFTSHLNFMPTPSVMKAFKKELGPHTTGKGADPEDGGASRQRAAGERRALDVRIGLRPGGN